MAITVLNSYCRVLLGDDPLTVDSVIESGLRKPRNWTDAELADPSARVANPPALYSGIGFYREREEREDLNPGETHGPGVWQAPDRESGTRTKLFPAIAASLSSAKAAKWQEIKAERAARVYTLTPLMVTSGGLTWPVDIRNAEDYQNVAGSAQVAALIGSDSPTPQWPWTGADNETVLLDPAQVIDMGLAVAFHRSAVYAVARTVRALIDSAATVAEVQAIEWSDGQV
jgi:hypothetical protein